VHPKPLRAATRDGRAIQMRIGKVDHLVAPHTHEVMMPRDRRVVARGRPGMTRLRYGPDAR